MAHFDDNAGNTWQVQFDIATARRLKSEIDFDLMKAVSHDSESNPFVAIRHDPFRIWEVIWFILKPQAQAMTKLNGVVVGGLDEDDLSELVGKHMDGDALGNAVGAIIEATIDFFPQPESRETLRQTVALMATADEAQQKQLQARIQALDVAPMVQAEVDALVDSGIQSMKQQASSASTPDH